LAKHAHKCQNNTGNSSSLKLADHVCKAMASLPPSAGVGLQDDLGGIGHLFPQLEGCAYCGDATN